MLGKKKSAIQKQSVASSNDFVHNLLSFLRLFSF